MGYGVGPQFFAGLGKDGPKQIAFTLIVMVFCLIVPIACAYVAGLDVGYAVGLYAGSQTISASIGVATDQINKSGLSADAAKSILGAIPVCCCCCGARCGRPDWSPRIQPGFPDDAQP